MTDQAPILEFDEERTAIIEPSAWHEPIDGRPSTAVMTWMADAFARLLDQHHSHIVRQFEIETSEIVIHEIDLGAKPVLAVLSDIGAPAAAALYEVLVAMGCTSLVAVGSSGGLLHEHPPGTVVVPDAMIRDEGLSYHYAPPARLAHPDPEMQRSLVAAFLEEEIHPIGGVLWTTDAFFRETPAKVAARVAEGAVAVDMEASALATVAAFRGVRHGHAVYMADTLHSDEWDPTELVERNTDYRYRLLLAAAHCAAHS